MSKESDQALVILAIIAGCAETLRQTNSFARVDIKDAISETYESACDAIIKWPGITNREWVKSRREQFMAFIFSTEDKGYSAVSVVKMFTWAAISLQDKFSVGIKSLLMSRVVINSVKIDMFCDPKGSNVPAHEKANFLLDELFKIIEWRE